MRTIKSGLHSGVYSSFIMKDHISVSAARSTNPSMAIVFLAGPYGTFLEIKGNLSRKKLHRTNQGFNFLGASFSNRENERAPIQSRKERESQHLKDDFFFKSRP